MPSTMPGYFFSRLRLFIFLGLTLTGFHEVVFSSVSAQLVPINPSELSSPPYGYLKESVRRLNSPGVPPDRYLTFLGAWENNGEANWERSTWWGRFYIDCKERTFKVRHFKHPHIGREWRQVERNYTALFGLEKLCPLIQGMEVESRSIDRLNEEFSRDFHESSSPFKAVY